jgi:hypothetical protein
MFWMRTRITSSGLSPLADEQREHGKTNDEATTDVALPPSKRSSLCGAHRFQNPGYDASKIAISVKNESF